MSEEASSGTPGTDSLCQVLYGRPSTISDLCGEQLDEDAAAEILRLRKSLAEAEAALAEMTGWRDQVVDEVLEWESGKRSSAGP